MFWKSTLAVVAAFALAPVAHAAVPVYATPGTVNPAAYSFTKLSDGDLIAWFVGRSADLDSVLGVKVNGVDRGTILSNTSPLGTSANYGFVAAGSTLEFYLSVSSGDVWSSDAANNSDGVQHIYSQSWGGGETVGFQAFVASIYTYVGWEDLPGGGDRDYNDHQFVFQNVRAVNEVPEPATWALMIAGFGLVGAAARRRRTENARA